MTIVDKATGEITVSYGEVKQSVAAARESGAKFFEQIVWQIENQAWSVLGYADWDEMREAEYGDIGVVVPRADRPEIVARLRGTGMKQQQIADTVGVSIDTVQRDLNAAPAALRDVTVTNSRGQERPAAYTPRAVPPLPRVEPTLAHNNGAITWRRNYMAEIAKSMRVIVVPPEDVIKNADHALIGELFRAVEDLNNYAERVRALLPTGLTVIKGDVQ